MIPTLLNIRNSRLMLLLSSSNLKKYNYKELIAYFHERYGKLIKPVAIRRNSKRNVPTDTICPRCGAPHNYLYDNNGGKGHFSAPSAPALLKRGNNIISLLPISVLIATTLSVL